MFHINPSTTALILIGASRFPCYPACQGLDRKSFSNAHKKIKKYFLRPHEGLDLSSNNVLDLFNSELPQQDQIAEAEQWIRSHRLFRDIFVYIVTHGKYVKERNRFFLKVKESIDESDGSGSIREDTHMAFETLYNQIFGTGSSRIYFIIDACDSGAVHMPHPDQVYISNVLHPMQEWGGAMELRSAALLTANSWDHIGEVYAPDEDKLPLFTECLLETLQKGIKGGYPYGLSLNTLGFEVNMRSPDKLAELNDPVCLKNSTRAQISDRSPSTPADGQAHLSCVPIFPNNDPANVKINFAAHRLRLAFNSADKEKCERKKVEAYNSALKEENHQFKTANQKLETEKEDLTEKLDTANQSIINLNNKNTKNKETIKKNEETIEILKRTNWRLYWLLSFIIALPLVGLALVLYSEPELLNLLANRIETALTPKK